MDFKQDAPSSATPPQPGTAAANALDQAALYRRAIITKIRLRQAIFRARHLAAPAPGPHRTAV